MHKTQAIVLYKQLWKESSFFVHLLTHDLGVIQAIVQGARKQKSQFNAHFEIGNLLEIIIAKSQNATIYKITSSSVISQLDIIGKPYTLLLSIQAALELYKQLVFSAEESQKFFNLLITFLEYIQTVKNNHLLVIWRFFKRLTDELGFPIVTWDGVQYKINDRDVYLNKYDLNFLETVDSWLILLPSTSKLINEFNIINPSCSVFNTFIFEWFELHLNKKITHKAMKLF